MFKVLKKFTLISLMVGFCLSSLACTEETVDSAKKPEIFDLVDKLYKALNSKTECDDIIEEIEEIKKLEFHNEACDEYSSELRDAGDYKYLAEKQTNSGYYTAAYILAYKLYDQVSECNGDKKKEAKTNFEQIFSKCANFLEHAEEINDSRLR